MPVYLRDRLRGVAVGAALAGAIVLGTAAALLAGEALHPSPRPRDPGVAGVDTTSRARLFVVILDSWRLQTATDSTLMPRTQALRARGASWPMTTVFEGFTTPALRAAFTGHAQTQLVNLIQNFSAATLPIESFFRDAQATGKRTVVVANEHFVQFGPFFETRFPWDPALDMYANDRRRASEAAAAWQRGDHDVVVAHLETFGWIAQEVGVADARYRAEAAYADSVIAALAALRRPGDYFLAFGDHGHTLTGAHKTGLDIPTFGLLLGPDVRPGVRADTLDITDIRFLASRAVGIALRPEPYHTARIASFLPVQAAATRARPAAAPPAGPRAAAWTALAVAVLGGAAALALRALPGTGLGTTAAITVALVAVGEALAATRWGGAAAVFPLLLAVAALLARSAIARAGLILLALFFASRWVLPPDGGALALRAPLGVPALATLYSAAVIADGAALCALAAPGRARHALIAAAAVAALQFALFDRAWACVAASAAAAAWLATRRDPAQRPLALAVLLMTLHTVVTRVSLYQVAWFDLFLLAVVLARQVRPPWRDALIAAGAFGLACGWNPGGLEWGVLYEFAPAYLVELRIEWFLPLIVAKLPLALLVTCAVAQRRPDRALAGVFVIAAAATVAVSWAARLIGADGVTVWTIAERALYLGVFAAAAAGVAVAAAPSARTTPATRAA